MLSNAPLIATLLLLIQSCSSYPIIAQIDEDSRRCFRFNIPGHDEGALVVMVLPNDEQIIGDDLEAWYVDQIYQMTKLKTKEAGIPNKLPNEPPPEVSALMTKFIQEHGNNRSEMRFTITDTPGEARPSNQFMHDEIKFFMPIVVNSVTRMVNPRARHRGSLSENLEGYGLCFTNESDDHHAHVIFDLVLMSEEVGVGDEPAKAKVGQTDFQKEKHLTPLEKSIEQSIQAAHAILREMKYMEKRESRMRQTAESINTRVRWFSYLSVAVLLTVTYLQVTYLKRYFHKKKLM